ncbi:MAG: DUF4234 domain-containing protein [Candidatus Aerophobetes bacterium]
MSQELDTTLRTLSAQDKKGGSSCHRYLQNSKEGRKLTVVSTVDYYYHEREEIAFLGKVSVALDKKGSSLTVNPTNPLHRKSYGLYIFLTIITLGIFGIYWAYVIFSDPNKHFDAHEVWDSELERIIEKDLA